MNVEFNVFDAPLQGISLVEAGAGTGKTYNIASLFVRAILEKELQPTQILVLTYTEAATAELKFRLRNRLKESIKVLEGKKASDPFLEGLEKRYTISDAIRLREALYNFDDAPISTIHGFCQRLLKEHSLAFNVSPEFEILANQEELLQEKIDQYWRDFIKQLSDEFGEVVQEILYQEGITPDKLVSLVKPAISKSYAEIVPGALQINEYQALYAELNQVFSVLKKTYPKESEVLDEWVQKGAFYKNALNAEERYYLNGFSDWLNSDTVPVSPFAHLKYFSSYIYNRVKKGFEVPSFQFTDLVDDYLELLMRIKDIKFSVIHLAIQVISIEFSQAKKEKDLLSYDDLLLTVDKGLNDQLISKLRKSYPIALIDEFQDTDPIQYSIFKKIYTSSADHAMFMIGDPKQAIYKFRGADIYTYLMAKKDAEYTYSLTHNFRSNPQIIDSVNAIFTKTKNPFLLEGLDFDEAHFPDSKNIQEGLLTHKNTETAQLQIIEHKTEASLIGTVRSEIAEITASEIICLLNDGYTINDKKVEQSDIAILVRKNAQAIEIQEQLRIRGIKSVIKNRESVFKTIEAEELFLILKAIVNYSFEDGIRASLATEALAYSAHDIIKLNENESSWNKIVDQFLGFQKLWREKGFNVMIDQFIHEMKIELNLAKYFEAERKITNLNHLIELLKKAERERKLSPLGVLRHFGNKKSDASTTNEDEIIRLESDNKLVQIVTVHASKGLEYPIVFCPYLWDAGNDKISQPFEFNDSKNHIIDIGTKDEQFSHHKSLYQYEELAESVRLAYVALTRAESACFVLVVDSKISQKSALSALIEGSEIVIKRLESKSDESTLMAGLSSLSSKKSIAFRSAMMNNTNLDASQERNTSEFSINEFTRKDMFNHPSLTSFSALSDSAKLVSIDDEKPGFDYDDTARHTSLLAAAEKNRFTLPKGSQTGTMLHNIFEAIDFNNLDTFDEAIHTELETSDIATEWAPIVKNMITDSVMHELLPRIKLFDIEAKDRIPEIEFHFPTSDISFNELIAIIRKTDNTQKSSSLHGFVKGYIDLTFRINGKYYILDYKSNYLGDNFKEYDRDRLKSEVLHSNYDLQYHLYVLALHRMLEQSIKDYDYDSDFGGVIYLFLRGVNSQETESGVHFDKPDYEVIKQLDALFRGETP